MIDTEKEIEKIKKEKDKRKRNKLKKSTKEIQEGNTPEGQEIPQSEDLFKGTNVDEFDKISKDLFVKYNARCKEYKNIKCTKYVFKVDKNDTSMIVDDKIIKSRYTAFRHFVLKNNINESTKIKDDYYMNLKNYNIIERLLVLVAETSIRTITLLDWFNRYGDENMEVIEYQIYIVQKKIEQGGCDTREHFKCMQSGDYFLNVKSLRSSDNNCGIGIFTNTLKIKLQPNTLRKTLKIPLGVQLNFEHMQFLSDFLKNDICVYKPAS